MKTPINDCILCRALFGKKRNRVENTILFETENYVAMPTIGQFIPGWVMVLSKNHVRRALAHSCNQLIELSKLVSHVRQTVTQYYGPTIAFEHGHGISRSNSAGCCVEHTHIHIAPCRSQTRFHSMIGLQDTRYYPIYELPSRIDQQLGYHIVSSEITRGFFAAYVVEEPLPGQYLRQVLALCTNKPHLWDWRKHPEYTNIRRTVNLLNGKFGGQRKLYQVMPSEFEVSATFHQ